MKILQFNEKIHNGRKEIEVVYHDDLLDRKISFTYLQVDRTDLKRYIVCVFAFRTKEEIDKQIDLETDIELTPEEINEQLEKLKIEREIVSEYLSKNRYALLHYFSKECHETRLRFMQFRG